MSKCLFLIGLLLSLLLIGCDKNNITPSDRNFDTTLGIETVPSSLGRKYTSNFDAYTKVTTPNGGAIHIVAQTNVTNEQIVRCRSVLEHFLANLPNSVYGTDKSEIANKMAENEAILTLLNGQDDGSNSLNVAGQALYQNEIQVEGHAWYINQNYEHRDATYEEILHLVHDTGIGVDGSNSSPGASPDFQAAIRAAQQNALDNQLWGLDAADWIKELTKENSLSQEYLAALIDAYYGLWGAWTESNTHSMWGIYVAKDRAEIATEDPKGNDLLANAFFHPYLTYNARIDPSFDGDFSLQFDETIPYTHHSRYLKNITLLGANNSNVVVNEWDNDITGNEGVNTVIFSGNSGEYSITTDGEETTVTDNERSRDGRNVVRNVEKLQFLDKVVEL